MPATFRLSQQQKADHRGSVPTHQHKFNREFLAQHLLLISLPTGHTIDDAALGLTAALNHYFAVICSINRAACSPDSSAPSTVLRYPRIVA
jgi:hypothetical protein